MLIDIRALSVTELSRLLVKNHYRELYECKNDPHEVRVIAKENYVHTPEQLQFHIDVMSAKPPRLG